MNMLPYRDGDILFEGRSVAGLATPDLARIGMAFMLQGGRYSKAFQSRRTFNWHFEDKTINLM